MKPFRELKVWQKAHEITIEVYRITKKFPADELYGLTSQMRQSASSVGANIAEGCARGGDAELERFPRIVMGSACKPEYHVLHSRDLDLIANYSYENINVRIYRGEINAKFTYFEDIF